MHREYPSHPFPSSIATEIAHFPLGFRELALQSSLGLDVLHIISRVSRYMASKNQTSEITAVVRTVPEGTAPDIFDTCAILQTSVESGHIVERNICLAIVLFAYNVYSKIRDSTTIYRGSRQALARTLPDMDYASNIERECLMWIYMVTIESWRNGHTLEPQGRELLRNMQTRFPEARSWSTLDPVLQKFFWYGPLASQWKICTEQGNDEERTSHSQRSDSPELRRAELHAIWQGQTSIRESKGKRLSR